MRLFFRKRAKLTHIAKLKRACKQLLEKANLECAVGYPVGKDGLSNPEAAYDDRASVIEVALANNYGTDEIPARPFMDMASREMQAMYKREMKKLAPKLIDGTAKVEKVLDVIGLQAEDCVREAIMSGDWQPNSPATIRQKKSDRPLIDTATMRNRVTHIVRSKR